MSFYSIAGNLIARRIVKSHLARRPDALDVTIPRDGVYPGGEIRGEIKAELPTFFVPGTRLSLHIEFVFHTRKPIHVTRNLAPGRNRTGFTVKPEHRGVYRSQKATFVVEDLLGFTESFVDTSIEEYVKVFPAELDRETVLMRIASDESTDTMKKKRVSDELLEVKKYYPGDDIRRLNWKVFAHTGELFVRKGEETPPPDVKLLFVIDPTMPDSVPASVAGDYLDSLLETCAALFLVALESGSPVIVAVPGRGEPRSFEPRAKNDLLTLLAGIRWYTEPAKLELPKRRGLHAVVFSSPGSPAIPGIVHSLRERNWETSLLLKNFVFPVDGKKAFDPRRIFFTNPDADGRERPSPREVIGFKQALYAEISKYRQKPWRIADVREI